MIVFSWLRKGLYKSTVIKLLIYWGRILPHPLKTRISLAKEIISLIHVSSYQSKSFLLSFLNMTYSFLYSATFDHIVGKINVAGSVKYIYIFNRRR